MLIKHVRDVNRNPIATIVGDDSGRIGVSVCSVKDNYNKRIGVQIASGRARSDKFDVARFLSRCPNRYICNFLGSDIQTLYRRLRDEYALMEDKLTKYRENS